MFAIIVGTHGLFAKELVRSCEMICGEQKNVRAVTLVPGEGPDDVVKKYEEAIKELDCSGGVLLGATRPNQEGSFRSAWPASA